ncbi:MAG: DUF6434 domain-containing protein [Bacteroidota bacterium]
MSTRPPFESLTTGEAFDNWYWSKEELTKFCKQLNIPATARKNELRRRIIQHFKGESITLKKVVIQSNFNWAKEVLTPETVITDSIKFGQNLRAFFKQEIGKKFSFSNPFMAWMRENPGKTLADAVGFWHVLQEKTRKGYRMDTSDFNVMNKYLDDFLKDNPNLKRDQGLICWGAKKYYPAKGGQVKYESADLRFLE